MSIIKKIIALMLCLVAATPLHAVIEIQNLDDITLNNWDGVTSNLTGFDDYCVISTFFGGTVQHLTEMQGPSDGGGDFLLAHSVSGSTLPVSVTWTHQNSNQSFVMTDGSQTGLVDGAAACTDLDATVRVQVTVSDTTLETAEAGTYGNTFEVNAKQFGWDLLSTGFQGFQVTLPELVQVNGLDDIVMFGDLGERIVGRDDFCIYLNHSGTVQITTTSLNGAGNNEFRLNGLNGEFINYRVGYRPIGSGSWENVTHGQPAAGYVGSRTRDCGGAMNTRIRVVVRNQDTVGKPAGAYRDTLTILVEPE